jgi:glycosyltransferase involved in cell wall biosynthesis
MMGAPTGAAPQLSVVIASIVGPPFIDDCLESLRAQAAELAAEVKVVACGTTEYADRIRRAFPSVAVIHRAERETVPRLRQYGVQQASGEIVAIIEEHCVGARDWLRSAAAAHAAGEYGAVGGPVVDHAYSRLPDWTVYFVEYNVSLPPVPSGETTFLNGANIAYRRRVLREHEHLLGQGYWEATLHPVLPFVLLGRMASRVWQKRCRVGKFALSVPLLLPALTVYVAGEWMGYLAGPGDALSKVE